MTGSEFLTTERKAALAHVWAEVGGGGSNGSSEAGGESSSGKVPLAVDMECAGVAQVNFKDENEMHVYKFAYCNLVLVPLSIAIVSIHLVLFCQVCYMNGIPFLGLRAISDTTEGNANSDFNAFCESAADGLWPIVEHVALNA